MSTFIINKSPGSEFFNFCKFFRISLSIKFKGSQQQNISSRFSGWQIWANKMTFEEQISLSVTHFSLMSFRNVFCDFCLWTRPSMGHVCRCVLEDIHEGQEQTKQTLPEGGALLAARISPLPHFTSTFLSQVDVWWYSGICMFGSSTDSCFSCLTVSFLTQTFVLMCSTLREFFFFYLNGFEYDKMHWVRWWTGCKSS